MANEDWPRSSVESDYTPLAYPAGPYGMGLNMTVPNLELLGLRRPTDHAVSCVRGQPVPELERIALAEFYDPDGAKGIELIMVNMSAVWCSVCRSEFSSFRKTGIYAEYKARKVEFVGVLFEDTNYDPAKPADISCWSSQYGVEFPMLLDPQFRTGGMFLAEATPMNVVIDARTMQIVGQFQGAGGAVTNMFRLIDSKLAERQ